MKKSNPTPLLLKFIAEEQILLRDFLKLKGLSKRALTAVKFEGGRIIVNGEERTVRWMLEQGDQVIIEFPPEEVGEGLVPELGELSILAEDDSILVVEKPAGQGTIPSRNHPNGTLANIIFGKYVIDQHFATVHVVTRLDTDTSGVVCIAKNRHIHHLMSTQMQQTRFDRRYIAFVSGWILEDTFTIEMPIGRKDGSIIERIVRPDGQYARTDVLVTGHFEIDGSRYTIVQLQLHTGRTHQIRVHMEYIGHPLLGDDLYGGPCHLISRQALHCRSISFKHPTTSKNVSFESELPQDLLKLLPMEMKSQEGYKVNFSG
ncbi:RluA family pseudouridine synthase [Sporosarcina gallistercoris]|uniref:Pseudouridine synthase n=1 Tax=Sporosarcina gallistercoris TaxID=2762245 RepID=A0ABR8PGN5_9BACL|nr:RluA family pseudouridine synthase [Sporosarcina gallistercoris]MBD7907337.1 RluA family pseudouridine synthase [Sporosarcina gallistercoris]